MMGKDMMGKDMMQSCCNMAAGGAMNCGSMMKMDAEPKK
jgi:hypothetical protein